MNIAPTTRTWVETEAAALVHNLQAIRSLVGSSKVAAVVKSNAYGHGLVETAGVLQAAGVDWLAVDSADEGCALRTAGVACPVLVLGYVPLAALGELVANDLRPVVYNPETLQALETIATKAAKIVPVHIKIETGTNRQGLRPADAIALCQHCIESSALSLEGVSMHFANIEDTTDHHFAMAQFDSFKLFLQQLAEFGISVPIRHVACSAAALIYPQTHLDLVRVGIAMYGMWPSKETRESCQQQDALQIELKPALSWRTKIVQVKTVEKGDTIGYGCTTRATQRSRIAVLPVGYYDGYDRGLSNQAHVLIHGERAAIRGRICMNLCMADVTEIPKATLEDQVTLLGNDALETISAEDMAHWLGTISYEVTARINGAVPRHVT